MISHTVTSYEKDLKFLKSSIEQMMDLTNRLIINCQKIIAKNDASLVEDSKSIDHLINLIDEQVEINAISMIALRQPVSIDLRQVVASLKLAVIIERIGDLLKNSVKRMFQIDMAKFGSVADNLSLILENLEQMIKFASGSFLNLERILVREIFLLDSKIDEIYSNVLDDLQQKIVNSSEDNAEQVMQLIFISKNLERVGDYITKIAQIIVFVKNGKKISKTEIKNIIKDGLYDE